MPARSVAALVRRAVFPPYDPGSVPTAEEPAVSTAPSPSTPPPTPVAVAPDAGATLWMTGLSGAGKSTVAEALAARLSGRVELLDGDEVREFLSKGLGFSQQDRDTNVLRIGWVAATLAKHGVLVLAAVISPYAATRDAVRALHEERGAGFLEVHVATPVEVCSARDVKGLYAKQRAGEMVGLTGVDAPYEAPTAPEVVLPTHEQSLDASVEQLLAVLAERGLLA